MMLSRIGNTRSLEIGGSGKRYGLSPSPTRLKSICSIINEPRSGANPAPVILTQLVNFTLFTLFTASMHSSTFSISSSVNFEANSFSTSPKSKTLHSLPTMAELLSLVEAADLFSSNTTAKSAFEGADRKEAVCSNIPFGRSERRRQSAALLLLRCLL